MSNTTNEKEVAKVETPSNQPTDLMGYEGQVTTAPETTLPETSNAGDVQSLINKTVKEVTVDENGKYVYPENIDPVLKAAVAATKSYRDNQSGFTKSQQSLKELEAERDALREQLAIHTQKPLELTTEDQTALDQLYTTDRDAWRAKMNMLEQQSSEATQNALTEATESARKKASGEFELQRRYDYLDTFNEGREVKITPQLLDTEIPPRITAKLADGTLTFEGYLDEVSEYLEKGKVATKVETKTTDLNSLNGSDAPSPEAIAQQGGIDYANTTF